MTFFNPENMKLYNILYKSGGIKLSIYYFLNCHLYDLINRTDTHRMMNKSDMHVESSNLENGLMYMVSWTSTLKQMFKIAQPLVRSIDCDFIDLGCGKGKVYLMAKQSAFLGVSNQSYYGVDFEPSLINIANSNSLKLFGDKGSFILSDVTNLDWNKFKENIVIYMYNPFNSKILTLVLRQIKNKKVVILYSNPLETETFRSFGYRVIHSTDKWHANLSFKILTNF
jgi:hypothetical protein